LKITDFGVSHVFKTQFEKEPRRIHGILGSAPYIAPEVWIDNTDYLPTKVDIWACGMIYYSMITKGLLWSTSQETDPKYACYLKKRETGFPAFEMQTVERKTILYNMLDPTPTNRPEASEMLTTRHMESVKVCIVDPIDPNQTFTDHSHL
jgi:serine/threonine protein kinase